MQRPDDDGHIARWGNASGTSDGIKQPYPLPAVR
jgi:hypothetical protein